MDRDVMCRFPDCDRPVERAGLCAGHRKQHQRGAERLLPLRQRLSPRNALREAAIAYAEADGLDDAAFLAADNRLRKAAVRFTMSSTTRWARAVRAMLASGGCDD